MNIPYPHGIDINASGATKASDDPELLSQNLLTARHVIEIAAGCSFILASDIPNRIAGILAPLPSSRSETILTSLEKRHCIGVGQYVDSQLTSDDWAILENVWRHLPLVKDSTKESFGEYRMAFESMPDKPNWTLLERFQNIHDEVTARKSKIRFDHAMLIDAAIKNGTLPALTDTRIRADKLWIGVTVSIEDARNYLKPMGFELHETTEVSLIKFKSSAPTDASAKLLPDTERTPRLKSKHVWDEPALRKLLAESKEAGITKLKLGQRYGVSRQQIAKVLEKAEQWFGKRKATAFDTLVGSNRKK